MPSSGPYLDFFSSFLFFFIDYFGIWCYIFCFPIYTILIIIQLSDHSWRLNVLNKNCGSFKFSTFSNPINCSIWYLMSNSFLMSFNFHLEYISIYTRSFIRKKSSIKMQQLFCVDAKIYIFLEMKTLMSIDVLIKRFYCKNINFFDRD